MAWYTSLNNVIFHQNKYNDAKTNISFKCFVQMFRLNVSFSRLDSVASARSSTVIDWQLKCVDKFSAVHNKTLWFDILSPAERKYKGKHMLFGI